MKKGAIKNFIHVLLIGSLAFTACSKSDTVSPQPMDVNGESAVTEATTGDVFTQQPLGVSVQKLTSSAGNVNPNYLLYVPDTYNSNKTYKWPLVIFLHGIGEMGTDINKIKNVGLPKVVKGKQFVMIAPQCTASWWNTDALQAFYKQIITKYHIDPKRVYLTGLSMGGFQTWVWGEYYPQQFAAIVPICGGGEVNKAPNLKTMPIWAFHNKYDPTVAVINSVNMVNAVRKAGNTMVRYTQPNLSIHDAWTAAYNNAGLYSWMLQQHKP